jgi:peptidoglycan hydrolase-like amidase
LASRTIFLLLTIFLAGPTSAQTIDIGVFSLFHPRQIELHAMPRAALIVEAGGETFVLEKSSGRDLARIELVGNQIELHTDDRVVKAAEIQAKSRSGDAVDFALSVPGKISRHYRGTLRVTAKSGVLIPVITMDLETAVASVVQAESLPDAPLEALKAQAVATRSYFISGRGRHEEFDFCDTTHCQFLREPPPQDSPASIAASQTRGLVLVYNERAFAPMFTRSCSGRTRTPNELGLPSGTYPYFSVRCKYCQEHPTRWQSRVPQEDAAKLGAGEAGRLEIDRKLGWSAVPSNDFTIERNGQSLLLKGTGQGHGIGLCQLGAKAMAEAGAGFREILTHYYPNTSLQIFQPTRETVHPAIGTR